MSNHIEKTANIIVKKT